MPTGDDVALGVACVVSGVAFVSADLSGVAEDAGTVGAASATPLDDATATRESTAR